MSKNERLFKMKLVIIGGVAGGATAAARARRLNEQAEIVLFERGEYISFANCGLPYYIGQVITERDNLLVTTPEAFSRRYHIDIRTFTEVVSINRKDREVEVRNIVTGETSRERYDKIILSPGAEPARPPIEGIDLPNIFSVRNIPDSDQIKKIVDEKQPESAVVIGGGFIGLEMAENLMHRGVKTTIIEMADQVMASMDKEMASIIHHHLEEQGIVLKLGQAVSSFQKKEDGLLVTTNKGVQVYGDLVILSIGVKPENSLAVKAGLVLSERGCIKVDGTMQTSDPNIYAVGDAVEVRDFVTGAPINTALAGPANKQGRIAADNVMGRRTVFRGTLGTSIVKLFNLTAAVTGPGEKVLKAKNIPFMTSYTVSGSHAGYYPGASEMTIKLIFSPGSGKILGAQVVGESGVDKRVDVLATAIRGGMTVYDLEELELAYAPPFSSAKDPVNVAGFVAANILKGDMDVIHWNEIDQAVKDGAVLIDLRTREELEALGTIKSSINIPVDELRGRLSEMDPEKTYILYCAVGLRGYVAFRIMKQKGFNAANLSGGYNIYNSVINGNSTES